MAKNQHQALSDQQLTDGTEPTRAEQRLLAIDEGDLPTDIPK